jgi:protein-L-isoaspartate(D-aspartate) O-methyltransferase
MTKQLALDNMVKQQLLTNRIENQAIIDLFYTLPRADFFDSNIGDLAYSDSRLPLAYQGESLTPLEEATILQSLSLTGTETVLEIGTGSGYLTALLANCSKEVITIEQHAELTKKAQDRFDKYGLKNILALTGDGSRGWMDKGPYDVIVIGGGLSAIGDHFKPQLMKGGHLFAFVGEPPCLQATLLTLDNKDDWHSQSLFDTSVSMLKTNQKEETFVF